jgi:hypothetical protein
MLQFIIFQIHPQSEDYWGHVNPIGPRACYDEGKRVAETLAYAYAKQSGTIINELLIGTSAAIKDTPQAFTQS